MGLGHAEEFEAWREKGLSEPRALENGFGFVVLCPGRRPLCCWGSVPPVLLVKLAVEGQYIFMLEALAQCWSLWLFCPLLRVRWPFWSFVGNSAAQWALTKGYSRNKEANVLVSLLTAAVVDKQADAWFERVSSAANLSDDVSRNDFGRAQKEGCSDFKDIRRILADGLRAELRELLALARQMCLAVHFTEVAD